jgi:hypothetical protein
VFTRAKSLNRYVSSKEDLFSVRPELILCIILSSLSLRYSTDREGPILGGRSPEVAVNRFKGH